LLKRVFDLDLQRCPNCDGDLSIIATIREPPVIEKILTLRYRVRRTVRKEKGV
jgi:hypothetical protein